MSINISLVGFSDNRIFVYSLISIIEKLNKRMLVITNNINYIQLDSDMNEIVDLGNTHIHYAPKPILGMEYGIYCLNNYDVILLDSNDLIYPYSNIIHINNGNINSYNYIKELVKSHIDKHKSSDLFVQEIIYKNYKNCFQSKGAFTINKKEIFEIYIDEIESLAMDDYGRIVRPYLFVDKELNIALAQIVCNMYKCDEKSALMLIKNTIERGI